MSNNRSYVHAAGAEGLQEELEPLEDGLIRRCLRAGDWASGGKSLWHRALDFLVREPGARPVLLMRCMRLVGCRRSQVAGGKRRRPFMSPLHTSLLATHLQDCALSTLLCYPPCQERAA